MLIDADGAMWLDVRLVVQTDEGATISMAYRGVGARDGDTTLRTAPMFNTGDERHRWLNSLQAVGIGQSDGSSVTYDIYALS